MEDITGLGFIGVLFLLIIGIGLYYITGDNNPYKRKKNLLIKGSRKPLPVKGITQIEADYKIVEISREPLKEDDKEEVTLNEEV